MENRRVVHSANRILFLCAAVALLATAAWAASSTRMIYSFAGNADGEYLDTELVMDQAGNLYGTTVQGGRFSAGTVFRVTPAGVHTVLYSFTGGPDGGEPYKGVTLDAAGNLYGTAVTGGSGCDGGCGVVYKLTNSAGTWTQSVIHTFNGSDGEGPGAPYLSTGMATSMARLRLVELTARASSSNSSPTEPAAGTTRSFTRSLAARMVPVDPLVGCW